MRRPLVRGLVATEPLRTVSRLASASANIVFFSQQSFFPQTHAGGSGEGGAQNELAVTKKVSITCSLQKEKTSAARGARGD